MTREERLNEFLTKSLKRINAAPLVSDGIVEILTEQFDKLEHAKDAQAELIKAYDEKIERLKKQIPKHGH